MQPSSISNITPNQKIVGVNKRFGNFGIRKQQGTTRVIYDTLTLTTTQDTFRFFEGVANRTFPQTNVNESANGLQVGESLSVDRMYLSLVTLDAVDGDIITLTPISTRPDITIGEMSIKIANTIILKPIPLSSFLGNFNKSSYFSTSMNFEFDTSLIFPPLLEFIVEIRTLIVAGTPNTELRLTIEGVGAILAPRNTF
ncbi:MAG: hypothetical protein IH845_04810 [Nanoarchaeota archaeon]|nr:hypothetical protein [Nanoarchaeota archaeon]